MPDNLGILEERIIALASDRRTVTTGDVATLWRCLSSRPNLAALVRARLTKGFETYGKLTTERLLSLDLDLEAEEEIADAIVYRLAAILKKQIQHEQGKSMPADTIVEDETPTVSLRVRRV